MANTKYYQKTFKKMNNIYIPLKWDYCISMPWEDISEYLSEEDCEKYKNQLLSADITLSYENNLGDKDVGLEPSFDFVDWNSSISYPEPIVDAINKRLEEFKEWYSNKAYEKLCDFIDFQKYGDY